MQAYLCATRLRRAWHGKKRWAREFYRIWGSVQHSPWHTCKCFFSLSGRSFVANGTNRWWRRPCQRTHIYVSRYRYLGRSTWSQDSAFLLCAPTQTPPSGGSPNSAEGEKEKSAEEPASVDQPPFLRLFRHQKGSHFTRLASLPSSTAHLYFYLLSLTQLWRSCDPLVLLIHQLACVASWFSDVENPHQC